MRSASVYAIFTVILQHSLIGSLTPLLQGQEWRERSRSWMQILGDFPLK
jgi:hypothetical protein